jgi:DNA-binding winged helix-turn-helix (wHTH) protein
MRVRFGPFELDEERLLLLRDGAPLRVRPMVFDLLVHLVRHRDRVVLRDELVRALWGRTAVGPGSLSGLVNELRQRLGESGRGPSSIRTVHARGYQFVARLEPSGGAEQLPELPAVLADALRDRLERGEVDLDAVTRWLNRARASQDRASAATAVTRRADGPSEDGGAPGRRMRRVEPGDTRMRRSRAGAG